MFVCCLENPNSITKVINYRYFANNTGWAEQLLCSFLRKTAYLKRCNDEKQGKAE